MRAIRHAMLAAPVLAAVWPAFAQPVTVRSDAGHFTVRVSGLTRSEPINRLHGFDLWLETADGRPASDLSIVLSGARRNSSNPLPTEPRVAPAPGEGHYRVEGLRFHMPGEWHLVFEIEFAQIRDRAALDVTVK